MTSTMKRLAAALLAVATLATIVPTGNAAAGSLVKAFPHLNGGLVGKQPVLSPPVEIVHGIKEIGGPRRLRARSIVIGIDGPTYQRGCYIWRRINRDTYVRTCQVYNFY